MYYIRLVDNLSSFYIINDMYENVENGDIHISDESLKIYLNKNTREYKCKKVIPNNKSTNIFDYIEKISFEEWRDKYGNK